jgi:hypothetical protein
MLLVLSQYDSNNLGWLLEVNMALFIFGVVRCFDFELVGSPR